MSATNFNTSVTYTHYRVEIDQQVISRGHFRSRLIVFLVCRRAVAQMVTLSPSQAPEEKGFAKTALAISSFINRNKEILFRGTLLLFAAALMCKHVESEIPDWHYFLFKMFIKGISKGII